MLSPEDLRERIVKLGVDAAMVIDPSDHASLITNEEAALLAIRLALRSLKKIQSEEKRAKENTPWTLP